MVTKAHIIVAAMKVFKMNKIDDTQNKELFPSDTESPMVLQDAVKKKFITICGLELPNTRKEMLKINGSCTRM